MTTIRTIIHVDLDQFFCAVEEQRDQTLRGKPFAVGGRPEGRGVVASQQVMEQGKAESKKLRAERICDAALGCRDAASYNCLRQRRTGHR